MIKDWLDIYKPKNEIEALQALREIMQETALAGLYREGFFEKAAFYGGTALRIFYGLDRFSEDLDFSLLKSDPRFSLDKYLKAVKDELASQGMSVTIKEKAKTRKTNIESAFLKSDTLWKELVLEGTIPQIGLNQVAGIKVKLEVDIDPSLGFKTEEKLLLRPFSLYVKCFSPGDLFAGKMHALLFRTWKNNVKGRDWYDLEWYIKKGIPLNLDHFLIRARASGNWGKETTTVKEFVQVLNNRINAVNMTMVKNDIIRFIPNPEAIEIWSPQYFHDLAKQLKIS